MENKPKLLAPAGNFISLKAALDNGADEIYFGIKGLNMRAGARNFAVKDLKKIAKTCHENDAKANLALNTIVYENELKKINKILNAAKKAGIDAIIAWDNAVIEKAQKKGFDVHLSTQASVSNYQALKSYKKKFSNLKRVVLARECSLDDVKAIIKKIKKDKLDVEVETFIHGAMCVSVSGRCFLSQKFFNRSANRGECIQPCRREYIIKDPEEKYEMILGKDYVMSPKDLCTMPFIDQLIDAEIGCFKIEGRNRNPEYVATTVDCYRTIIDYYEMYKWHIKRNAEERKEFQMLKKKLVKRLENVYNKGFSSGFFMGKPVDEWSKVYGNKAKQYKLYVGKVINYYVKKGVAEVLIESYFLKKGAEILFIGNKTGVLKQKADEIRGDAKKGNIITIKTKARVRNNDELYKVIKRN